MDKILNPLPEGTVLRGPKNSYSIKQALGQGTFGITYLATTKMKVTGQMGSFTAPVQVAVKEFFMHDFNGRQGTEVTASSQGGYFADYKRKFMREAESLAKLQHPHIVKVLESFEANGTAYYVMEFIDGGSLEKHIEENGAMKEAEALRTARQIGEALDYMHQHQMLHLDLKPANVMLRSTGEAVLIDFGLSKQFDQNGNPESSTTLGGGTPGYAPVEQANYQRGEGLPVTMDVYAFGATLFKMLTGERPPKASDVLNDGLPTFVMERKGVSAGTIAVVEKAMKPIVRKRYQSVREVVNALGRIGEQTVTDHIVKPVTEETPKEKDESTRYEEVKPQPRPETPWWAGIPKWVKYGGATLFCLLLVVFGVKLCGGSISDMDQETTEENVYTTEEPVSQDDMLFTVSGVAFKMVRVEGGTFTMGATSEQGCEAFDDEKPAHQVTLSSYYIGETEVTQALWEAVMGKNPSYFKGSNLPVEQVSWEDCQDFIRELNTITGKRFRLPTEAEWEFAARGGNKSNGSKYSGSNSVDRVAWHDGNSGSKTHDVKTKAANELGIYDMSGNVWEWCQDWYGSYSASAQTNPTGASSGSYRVHRGGSWYSFARCCRVSYRGHFTPADRHDDLGLRLAL